MPASRLLRLAAAAGLVVALAGCTEGVMTLPGATGLGGFGGLAITRVNIDPSTVRVARGQTLALSVETSNPSGGNLFYSWTATGGTLRPNNSNPVQWTAPNSAGRAIVKVYVQNTAGEIAQAEFGFNVE